MWGKNFILLPLSWLGDDVYLDTTDNTLCYEADAERLIVLTRCNLAAAPLRYRERKTADVDSERTQTDSQTIPVRDAS